MIFKPCATLLCITLISGCAQLAGIPGAEPFPHTTLKKAKSAEHWRVIAGDVAAQTAGLKDRAEFQGRSLYVLHSGDNSDFSRAFKSMLISNLVNSGLRVATKPEGAVQVGYEAQVVRHLARQGDYQPGDLTALAGGIFVAREIRSGSASPTGKFVGATALVAAAELAGAVGRSHRATNTEVIITTSVVDNSRFLLRKTDVYYVEDAEGVMFEAPFRPQVKTMEVTGR